jgi:hypothetical protein
MDPNDLIKAAPEIAKGAGALAAAIPFTAIVKRMLGPAADAGDQRERWVGSGLLVAEKQFLRIKGHKQVPLLFRALNALAPSKKAVVINKKAS